MFLAIDAQRLIARVPDRRFDPMLISIIHFIIKPHGDEGLHGRNQPSLDFFERAFGLARRFLHESNEYGELDTGATVLAFAHDVMASRNGLTVRFNRAHEPAAITPDRALVTMDKAFLVRSMPL